MAVLGAELASQRQDCLAYLKRSRHDILGALNIVSGFLELMQANGTAMMDDTHRSYMGHMTAGVRRCITLAESLETNFAQKQNLKEEAR